MIAPRRLALLNPNTSQATTELMLGIARSVVPKGTVVEGHTMLLGPQIVTDEAALVAAARQIVIVGKSLAIDGVAGLLISGFGDPGLEQLRPIVSVPVTGIAEAGMAAAGAEGRRFSVITTTPLLKASIEQLAERYGFGACLASVRITPGNAEETMADRDRMLQALLDVARLCRTEDRAEALLIGGGPLATAADAIAAEIDLPVVEPVREGARLAVAKIAAGNGHSADAHRTARDGPP